MTKKDYEAIAAEARNVMSGYPEGTRDALDSFLQGITIYMAQDNPNFRRLQFLAACRGEDYKGSNGRTSHYSKGVSDAR